jgi:Protein of unknown function (DUF3108)
MRSWFSLAISAAAWAAAAWGAPPQRVELAYDLSRNGTRIAEVSYLLEHDGRSYQITETTKGRGVLALRGTIRRTSRGMISPQGLKPVEFVDERTGRNTARAVLDWNAKTATQQYKGEPSVEPLPAHAHDRLAFAFDFAFAPPARGEVIFDLFNDRGQSRHVYTAAGRSRTKTPIGELEAMLYVRGPAEDRTELWLAVERALLPVKIVVLEKDGTRFEQVLTKITPP